MKMHNMIVRKNAWKQHIKLRFNRTKLEKGNWNQWIPLGSLLKATWVTTCRWPPGSQITQGKKGVRRIDQMWTSTNVLPSSLVAQCWLSFIVLLFFFPIWKWISTIKFHKIVKEVWWIDVLLLQASGMVPFLAFRSMANCMSVAITWV